MRALTFITLASVASCGGTETVEREQAVCTVPAVPAPEVVEVERQVIVEKEVVQTLEVPVITEKVVRVTLPLQYVTNVCRRDVVKTGPHHYAVVSDRLVRLSDQYQELYTRCDVRIKKGKLQVRER